MQEYEKKAGKMLFFSDIDETLVNTDKSLSDENRAAVEEFLAHGNILVISTGRALSGASNLMKDLGLYGKENVLISSCNGAVIYDTYLEQELLRRPVPLDLMVEAFDLARDFGIHIQTYTETGVVSETDNESLQRYIAIQRLPVEYVSNIKEAIQKAPLLKDITWTEEVRQSMIKDARLVRQNIVIETSL